MKRFGIHNNQLHKKNKKENMNYCRKKLNNNLLYKKIILHFYTNKKEVLVKLISIRIDSFKGIKQKKVETGKVTRIEGKNGTGKTSIVDAYLWLMTGKDSQGNAQFDIIHKGNKEATVEATVELEDGHTITLKKNYKEVWKKKRGFLKKQLTGHTVDHYVNDVPVKKSEFNTTIDAIVEQDKMQLLTNATAFLSLHWEKQRKILLDNFAEIDKDEIKKKVNLQLPDKYKKLPIKEIIKIYKKRERDINDRMEILPAKIDENSRYLQEIKTNKTKEELENIQRNAQIEKERMKDTSNEEARRKRKKLYEKKIELSTTISTTEGKINRIEYDIAMIEDTIKEAKKDLLKIEEQPQKEFSFPDICPTCKQDIPQSHKNMLKEEARIDHIKEIKNEKQTKQKKIEHNKNMIQAHINSIKKGKEVIKKAKEILEKVNTDLQNTEKIKQIDYTEIDKRIEETTEDINNITNNEKVKMRIQELEREESILSNEYTETAKMISRCYDYLQEENNAIETSINKNFNNIKFRLGKRLLNQEIKPTCEAEIDGIPVASANNSAIINAGIEIINVLQKAYSTKLPILIDNAESINELTPTNSQIIATYVTEEPLKIKIITK